MDITPSWQSIGGMVIIGGSWAVSNGKPLDWTVVFPLALTFCGGCLVVQNQIARGVDKLIERDVFKPAGSTEPEQIQPEDRTPSRVTSGNVNVEVPNADGWKPVQHTTAKPASLQLKQTRQGWTLRGLGGAKKRQLHPAMVEYQYTTDSVFPKPDSESLVAERLIVQRNSNLAVDLREAYWVKGKHFPESADKFRAMLRKWQYHGMIERIGTNGNSTFTVTNWKKLRGVAKGVTLPPPPAEYKP